MLPVNREKTFKVNWVVVENRVTNARLMTSYLMKSWLFEGMLQVVLRNFCHFFASSSLLDDLYITKFHYNKNIKNFLYNWVVVNDITHSFTRKCILIWDQLLKKSPSNWKAFKSIFCCLWISCPGWKTGK